MMGLFELYTLLVFTSVICVDYVTTCSCMRQHPQTMFCNADFVMQARLRGEGEIIYKKEEVESFETETNDSSPVIRRYPVDVKYNVRIRELFKFKDNTLGLNENSTVAEIHTNPDDSLCGVTLEQRTKYLLSGHFQNGQLKINLCSWNKPWPWISKIQKKGLRFTYGLNCDCKVQNTRYSSEMLDTGNTCKWDPISRVGECYERQTACIHDKNSSTGECKWHRNKRLRKCRRESKSAQREP